MGLLHFFVEVEGVRIHVNSNCEDSQLAQDGLASPRSLQGLYVICQVYAVTIPILR